MKLGEGPCFPFPEPYAMVDGWLVSNWFWFDQSQFSKNLISCCFFTNTIFFNIQSCRLESVTWDSRRLKLVILWLETSLCELETLWLETRRQWLGLGLQDHSDWPTKTWNLTWDLSFGTKTWLETLASGLGTWLETWALGLDLRLDIMDSQRLLPIYASSFVDRLEWFFKIFQIQARYTYSYVDRLGVTFLPIRLLCLGHLLG